MLVGLKITQHLLYILKWTVVNPHFESFQFAAVSEREHSSDFGLVVFFFFLCQQLYKYRLKS